MKIRSKDQRVLGDFKLIRNLLYILGAIALISWAAFFATLFWVIWHLSPTTGDEWSGTLVTWGLLNAVFTTIALWALYHHNGTEARAEMVMMELTRKELLSPDEREKEEQDRLRYGDSHRRPYSDPRY